MEHKTPFDADRYVDTAAAAIGLNIAPELRPGVIASFKQTWMPFLIKKRYQVNPSSYIFKESMLPQRRILKHH